MRKTAAIAAFLALTFMVGCDSGGDGDDGGGFFITPCDISTNPYAPTTVVWWIDETDGSIHYENADEDKVVKEFYPNYRIMTIVWNCADYVDADGNFYNNIYVSLTFEAWAGEDQNWKLESEIFGPGICDQSCP